MPVISLTKSFVSFWHISFTVWYPVNDTNAKANSRIFSSHLETAFKEEQRQSCATVVQALGIHQKQRKPSECCSTQYSASPISRPDDNIPTTRRTHDTVRIPAVWSNCRFKRRVHISTGCSGAASTRTRSTHTHIHIHIHVSHSSQTKSRSCRGFVNLPSLTDKTFTTASAHCRSLQKALLHVFFRLLGFNFYTCILRTISRHYGTRLSDS